MAKLVVLLRLRGITSFYRHQPNSPGGISSTSCARCITASSQSTGQLPSAHVTVIIQSHLVEATTVVKVGHQIIISSDCRPLRSLLHRRIDRVRSSTAAASRPVIIDRPVTEPLSVLRPMTVAEVAAILKKSPAEQCQLDPVPTWLVKRACESFAPVISRMCNASLKQSKLPVRCKKATVQSLLKKQSSDPNDPSSTVQFQVGASFRKSLRRSSTPHAGSVSTSPNTVFCLSINLRIDLTTRRRQQSSAS